MTGAPSDLLEDALLLAVAGVRQKAKNLLILRALRDGSDYSPAWHRSVIRREFDALSSQSRVEADRLSSSIVLARFRRGRAQHARDYRTGDVDALKSRRHTLQALAQRLRRLGADAAAVDTIAQEATQLALDEIVAAAALAETATRSPLDDAARADAVSGLLQDLARLTPEER